MPPQPPQLTFTRTDTSAIQAKLGTVTIGTIFYNTGQSLSGTDGSIRYVVTCRLPGIKERLYASEEQQGQVLLQRCLELFLKKAGLTQ